MTRKNQIRIHQAFYGEVSRSHGCLFSTIDDAELKTFLTGFTDRPSAIPAGIVMQPYYSAIAHGRYYVFTQTFLDNNAQRGGMVFTHALIVDVEDLEYVNNLYDLFDLFCKSIPEDKTSLQALSIPISDLEIKSASDTFAEYILLGARELATGNLPIVFCGASESFIKLISSVWAGLPQSFRAKISYTTGFSIANQDTSKTFIHFQSDLKEVLKSSRFVSDENNNLTKVDATVERYILTPNADNQFELFIKNLNVNLDNWGILQSCAKAYEGYKNYSQLNNGALRLLIRELAKISPNMNDGKVIKGNVVAEVKQRIDSVVETNLKSLKNLPLDAFDKGESFIANAVKSYVELELTRSDDFNSGLISDVIILSQDETPSIWWHVAIKNAFKKVINNQNSAIIQNIWKLLVKSDESLIAVLSFLPDTKRQEDLLTKHFPSDIPRKIAERFAKLIQKRKWFILHAFLIRTYLTSKEAAKLQLSLEKALSSDSLKGTEYIVKDITEKELLSLAIETNDEFFISEYAERSVKKATLLNELDIASQTWLLIWATSLKKTNSLQHGIIHLPGKLIALLNGIADGNEAPNDIISHIANSDYADVSQLKNRASLWRHLPADAKELFLRATADKLLERIFSDGLGDEAIEQELMTYISGDKYMTILLSKYRWDISTVLEIYERINGVKDSFFADYIKNYQNNLNEIQSARLGSLISSKRFSLSARQVFEKAKHNSSFKIALTKCQSIAGIGFWDKFLWGGLIGETVSIDSVYSELTRISVRLYDKGPEDSDIWKRAGGDVSKLHNHRSREENWRTALNLLRNGGGGKNITIKSLIKEMEDDHPNNSELKQIAKYFK